MNTITRKKVFLKNISKTRLAIIVVVNNFLLKRWTVYRAGAKSNLPTLENRLFHKSEAIIACWFEWSHFSLFTLYLNLIQLLWWPSICAENCFALYLLSLLLLLLFFTLFLGWMEMIEENAVNCFLCCWLNVDNWFCSDSVARRFDGVTLDVGWRRCLSVPKIIIFTTRLWSELIIHCARYARGLLLQHL